MVSRGLNKPTAYLCLASQIPKSNNHVDYNNISFIFGLKNVPDHFKTYTQPETALEEDSDTDSPEEAARRAALSQQRRLVASLFSAQELRSLTSELGVNYDSLPGKGLEAKVRELIDFMASRQRLADFIQVVKQERPRIKWPPGADQ